MKTIDKTVALDFSNSQEEAFETIKSLYTKRIFKSVFEKVPYGAAARLLVNDIFEDLWRGRSHFREPMAIDFFLRQHAGNLSNIFSLCAAREMYLAPGKNEPSLVDKYTNNSLVLPVPFNAELYDSVRWAKTGILDHYTSTMFYYTALKKQSLKTTAIRLGISQYNLGRRCLVALYFIHANFLSYLNSSPHFPEFLNDN